MLGTIFEYYYCHYSGSFTIPVRTYAPILKITICGSYPDLQIQAYVLFFIFGSDERATSEVSCEVVSRNTAP